MVAGRKEGAGRLPPGDAAVGKQRHLDWQRSVEVVAAERTPQREAKLGIEHRHPAANQPVEGRTGIVRLKAALERLERSAVIAAYESRITEIHGREPAIPGILPIPAVVQPPERERVGAERHQVGSEITKHSRVGQRAGTLRELHAVAAAADRARDAVDGGVPHEGRGGLAEVEPRLGTERRPILRELAPAPDVVHPRRDVLLQADLAHACAEVHALRPAEGVRDDPRERAVDLQDAVFVLDVDVLPLHEPEASIEAACDIRRLVDRRSPHPAVSAVDVHQRAAELVETARHLRGRHDRVIAEHVAEHERHAARGIGAERVRSDPDRRLPDEVETELGLVVFDGRRNVGGRKAEHLVVERREHRPLPHPPGRKDGRILW